MAKLLKISILALLLGAFTVAPTLAGTLALEGSDATALHHDSTYITQLFGFLKAEGGGLPVFVLGGVSLGAPAGADTVYGAALPATLLGVHSAVYVESPGGCCDETALSPAVQTTLRGFLDAGGSVAIQNYQGRNDILTGFDPPSSKIGGFDIPAGGGDAGGAGGPFCFDTEVFLPDALLKGFTQPPVLGCWAHQAYDLSFFGPLGFVSLVDSGPQFDSIGSGDWSSFLVKGGAISIPGCRLGEVCGEPGTPTPGVPAPAALLMLGAGLLGIGLTRRFHRR
jgi:hypothetical protein